MGEMAPLATQLIIAASNGGEGNVGDSMGGDYGMGVLGGEKVGRMLGLEWIM